MTDRMAGPIGAVPDNWELQPLGKLANKIGSGATPRGGAHVYLEPAHAAARLIRSQNVFDRRFDRAGLVGITQKDAALLAGVSVQEGDILLNITGDGLTFARSCLAPSDILPACVNQHVSIIRLDQRRALPGYVVSFLTHPLTKRYIESFNAGGSRRAVTKGHIESFVVPLPPLPEQHAIAEVLGALDDKIELNRRTNGTLEQLGQALLAVAVQREGSVGRIGDLARLCRDGIAPASLGANLVEHYSLPAFDGGRMPAVEPATAIKSNKLRVFPDSVLVSKLNPHIPRVWLPSPSGSGEAIASTEWLVLRPRHESLRSLVYALCAADTMTRELASRVTGTTGSHQRVRPEDFLQIEIRLPDPERRVPLAHQLDSLYALTASNSHESPTLSRLRDVLLPKLISGELRIKEAEDFVEEAV